MEQGDFKFIMCNLALKLPSIKSQKGHGHSGF